MSTRFYVRCLRAVLIGGAVSLVAACMVGPDYVRPAVKMPAAYKEAHPGQARGAYLEATAGRWWQIYRDPTLDALIPQISVNNQSLAAAEARVREAQQLVQVARGPLVPSISAGTFKAGRRNTIDIGVAASWEIDLWGRIRRDVESHRASAEASADDLAAATLSMQAQAVQSYFALREDDAVIGLLQAVVEVDGKWVQMVQNQHAQGLASSADIAEAFARLSAAQTQLANTRTSRAQLEHALAVMLGKPPADFSLAPAPFAVEVPEIPADVPASLLRRRPDIAASERRMAAASAHIGVAKAETLPSISLAAGIGVIKGPRATGDLNAPLFTGGKLQAQLGHAWAAYAEAEANYRQTVLDAYREVEDNLVAANNLAGAVESQARAARMAQESQRVTGNQYQQGVADYQTVVETAATALGAGQGDLQLRLQRLEVSVNLIKALGGGWQADAGQGAKAPAAPQRAQAASGAVPPPVSSP